METIDALLARTKTVRSSSPRLIWYGTGHERVELSGRVLENWVAKTANYLVDELDAGPGTVVRLDMGVHWRSLCWALAIWQVGATLQLGPVSDVGPAGDREAERDAADSGGARNGGARSGGADKAAAGPEEAAITVTAAPRPDLPGTVVAVALGALQMRWPGALPAGVLDYAGEVRACDDVFFPMHRPDERAIALSGARSGGGDGSPAGSGQQVSYAELLTGFAADPASIQAECDAAGQDAAESGAPVPVTSGGPVYLPAASEPLEHVLRLALGVWRCDGTLMLTDPGVDLTTSLLASERVSNRR